MFKKFFKMVSVKFTKMHASIKSKFNTPTWKKIFGILKKIIPLISIGISLFCKAKYALLTTKYCHLKKNYRAAVRSLKEVTTKNSSLVLDNELLYQLASWAWHTPTNGKLYN